MMIDSSLIERCLKGDSRAEHELYQSLYGMLITICKRYTHQEERAREFLNVGFFRVLQHLHKYKATAPFEVWARKVIINSTLNELRKERIHYGTHTYQETQSEDARLAVFNQALSHFETEFIIKQIELLPAASKNVFNLYVIDGYSHKEIGDLLGISVGTSKWHLNFARTKLQELLTEKKTSRIINQDAER